MPRTAVLRTDYTLAEGGRKCSKCQRVKPVHLFTWIASRARHHSWCKLCVRIGKALERETPEGKNSTAAYNAREDVRARKAAEDSIRHRTPRRKRQQSEYQTSPRGRIICRRNTARVKLRKAMTDERRSALQALIDKHTAELAALEASDEN